MKKIKNLFYAALVVLSLGMLGAWAPVSVASAEIRFADAQMYSTYATETITFDNKETDYKKNYAPQYYLISGLKNACGALAGTEVVGFYDKYHPSMIPIWESFYASSGKYKPQDDEYVPNVMNELYKLMNTNVGGTGVSESDFVNGLKRYIMRQGYVVNMQCVSSGTSIDYAACKTAINNNKAIVLLIKATDVYLLSEGTTQDSISTVRIADSHIMMVSGYHEIKYYKSGSLFRTDRYLIASSGSLSIGTVYYRLNDGSLSGAYIVDIL